MQAIDEGRETLLFSYPTSCISYYSIIPYVRSLTVCLYWVLFSLIFRIQIRNFLLRLYLGLQGSATVPPWPEVVSFLDGLPIVRRVFFARVTYGELQTPSAVALRAGLCSEPRVGFTFIQS